MQLYQGDCLELMKEIPDGSVDLVLCDPPYGTINGGCLHEDWDEPIEPSELFPVLSDKLRPNGKCLLFSQEPYTSNLVTNAIPSLPFCYRAIWLKNTYAIALGCNKAMVSRYEDICLFSKVCPKHDFNGGNPLRIYFKKILDYIDAKSCKEINKTLGHRRAEHCFYVTESKGEKGGSTQFSLCTEETYNELISVYGIDKMDGFTDYNALRKIQNEYQNDNINKINVSFPSVFNLWQGNKSKSNILEYAKENERYHPTQKPVALLEDLIQTFSNEGDTVLDFTMGSGSTGVACVNTHRDFIGIELDPHYFEVAKERIQAAQA